LDYLGIPFTPDQVYDLVRKLALQNEVCLFVLSSATLLVQTALVLHFIDSCSQGLVAYADFKHVFKKSDDDLESHIAEGGDSNFEPVPPKNIPELCDMRKVSALRNRNSHFCSFHISSTV
jgi:hypothetical protein